MASCFRIAGLILLIAFPAFGGSFQGSRNVRADVAPSGVPNILIFVIDDLGSSNMEGFGGQYETTIKNQLALHMIL